MTNGEDRFLPEARDIGSELTRLVDMRVSVVSVLAPLIVARTSAST